MSAVEHRWVATSMEAPTRVVLQDGTVTAYTRAYDRESGNQDALACLDLGARGCVLVLADGAGGTPGGGAACALAVDAVLGRVGRVMEDDEPLQQAVLASFDAANDAIRRLGIGAASTLVVVTVEDASLRSYHAGDSGVLVTGQRGRVRLATIPHSPTGYAVEAGYLSEEQALGHEERHLVSNVLGADDMRIEVGPRLQLAHYDTVVLASDGLLDNLHTDEIANLARKGPLLDTTARLAALAAERMAGIDADKPGKPDDLSMLLYRPRVC